MGYYMGDYYAGSRGDPGLGSFFKGALGMGVGMIPGVGGIVGRVVSKFGGAATAGRSAIKAVGGVIMKHPVMSAAGAAGIVGLAGGAVSERALMAPGARGLRGFHPCKSKHGCKQGAWVRNRRMNVCNPRALRRSIRRTHGFAKLAMRTIHLVYPKKKAKFGGFKKKSKK